MSAPYHVVMEVENKQCKILNYFKSLKIPKFKIIDVRGFSGGAIRHLVEIPKDYADKVLEVRDLKARKGGSSENKVFLWFESEGCDVCNTILSHCSFLVSGKRIRENTFLYDFVAPDFEAYKSIISALKSRGYEIKVLKIRKFKPMGKILTERQERVLWFAFKTGFFDYPRKIDTLELSRILGIKPSTLSEIIRRGIKRLLEHYFESELS